MAKETTSLLGTVNEPSELSKLKAYQVIRQTNLDFTIIGFRREGYHIFATTHHWVRDVHWELAHIQDKF